jgi:hypothetical protein
MKTKILLVTAALAMLVTTDALAKSRGTHRSHHSWWASGHAYAMAPFQSRRSHRSRNVYDTSGFFVGRDPDPDVRAQLAHDPESGVARSTRMRRR